jgi:hypothetical protein
MAPMAGCVATATGMMFCTLLAEATGFPTITHGCHASGLQHVSGSCFSMMGRIYQVLIIFETL